MDLEKLGREIVTACYLEGDFILSSGKRSNYYFDKYLFITRPDLLNPVLNEMKKLLPPENEFDLLAGPELGGVTLATGLSLETGKPFIIVKKAVKDYGTSKIIEGNLKEGSRVVLVEDILTSGRQAVEAADKVKKQGGNVVLILGVIDREEGAREYILNSGYNYKVLFTRSKLGV